MENHFEFVLEPKEEEPDEAFTIPEDGFSDLPELKIEIKVEEIKEEPIEENDIQIEEIPKKSLVESHENVNESPIVCALFANISLPQPKGQASSDAVISKSTFQSQFLSTLDHQLDHQYARPADEMFKKIKEEQDMDSIEDDLEIEVKVEEVSGSSRTMEMKEPGCYPHNPVISGSKPKKRGSLVVVNVIMDFLKKLGISPYDRNAVCPFCTSKDPESPYGHIVRVHKNVKSISMLDYPYMCNVCCRVARNLDSLLFHTQLCSRLRWTQCPLSSVCELNKTPLIASHMASLHRDIFPKDFHERLEKLLRFSCPICNAKLQTYEGICYHLNKFHLTEGLFDCWICSKQFFVLEILILHVVECNAPGNGAFYPKKIIKNAVVSLKLCPLCNGATPDPVIHLTSEHKDSLPPEVFSALVNQMHYRSFVCNFCAGAYGEMTSFAVHLMFCMSRLWDQAELRFSSLKPTTVENCYDRFIKLLPRPILAAALTKCIFCRASLVGAGNFYKHLRTWHVVNGATFSCHYCSFGVEDLYLFSLHFVRNHAVMCPIDFYWYILRIDLNHILRAEKVYCKT